MGIVDRISKLFDGARPVSTADAERPDIGAYGDRQNNAASMGRELGKWLPWAGSADSDAMFDQATVRSRARDLDRNEALARGALDSITTSVIGAGLRCKPDVDYEALGKTEEWAIQFRRSMAKVFRAYLDSKEVDATGFHDAHGQAALMLRNMMLSGNCLGIFYWLKDDSRRTWRTCIRVVEADRLRNPNGCMDTPTLRGGIELGPNGEHVAYNILKYHPGDITGAGGLAGALNNEYTRVEKYFAWGRQQVIYMMDRERPDQNYGLSFLSAVIPEFKVLSDYKKAELQCALANAMVAIIVESQGSFDDVKALFGGDSNAYFRGRETWLGRMRQKLGFGSVLSTMPGDKVQPFLPTRPNAQAVEFVTWMSRHIATGLGLPLEAINHDWGKLNYSAARTVLLDAQRTYRVWRKMLSQEYYQVLYTNAMEEAVFRGLVPDCDVKSWFANKAAWSRCKWGAPAKGWVDEVKEATAAQTRMAIGLTNLDDECDAQGTDWMDVVDQRARERDYFAKKNLPYPVLMAPPGVRLVDPNTAGTGPGAGHNGGPPLEDENGDAIDPEKQAA